MVSDGWKPLVRCHVMEVESFENEGVAKLLNDWFVSIKVIIRFSCFMYVLVCDLI